MKKSVLAFLIMLSVWNAMGQDITGQWNGILKVQGMQLRIVFNISKTENGYQSTMDSPDQGARGIPVTSTSFADSLVKLVITSAMIEYTGKLNGAGNIIGNFKQAGMTIAMDLTREKVEKEKLIRPQEPVKPYPYYSEDVKFENGKARITLAGTLTLPGKEGNYPAVILISGSGPQNRDEELLGHKPFLVLADHLTKNGIAVLRFDDRGTGESTGDFKAAITSDFASDAEAAIKFLQTRKEINPKKIGLIGHSEGGIIAPMVASESKAVSFIVLLAGTGIPGNELLLMQKELIERASGVSDAEIEKGQRINSGAFELVIKSTDTEKLKEELTDYLKPFLKDSPDSKPTGMSEEDFINVQVNQLTTPWMQNFIRYNPAISLKKVKCPVLAINGEKDLQVPPEINLKSIKYELEKGGNKQVTVKELPNLNHLFQECKTGSPDEYAGIEQTFSPLALAEITTWILNQVK